MADSDIDVKRLSLSPYIYSADALDELEATLSPDRFATYLKAANGGRESAARLYTWNTAVSAAFYGPLQALEIALRNSMHNQLVKAYGAQWCNNPLTGLDNGARDRINQAKSRLKANQSPVHMPDLIASLSFGFWVSLLGSGGHIDVNRTRRANYEMTLWRPALRQAFPCAVSLTRKRAHRPLDHLRNFRNRIVHHEPVFRRPLQKYYQNILDVMNWLCPHKKDWVEAHCRVPELLALQPNDPSVRF